MWARICHCLARFADLDRDLVPARPRARQAPTTGSLSSPVREAQDSLLLLLRRCRALAIDRSRRSRPTRTSNVKRQRPGKQRRPPAALLRGGACSRRGSSRRRARRRCALTSRAYAATAAARARLLCHKHAIQLRCWFCPLGKLPGAVAAGAARQRRTRVLRVSGPPEHDARPLTGLAKPCGASYYAQRFSRDGDCVPGSASESLRPPAAPRWRSSRRLGRAAALAAALRSAAAPPRRLLMNLA